jgi:hypothetical protein
MRRGLVLAVLTLMVVPAAAAAATPHWTAQQLATPTDAYVMGAGIDATGTVTVLTRENDRVVGRMRRPGQGFSAPIDLGAAAVQAPGWGGPAVNGVAELAVADNGDVLVVTADKFCPPASPYPCDARLYARVGPDIMHLSGPELLGEGVSSPEVSVAPNGHMLVAWRAGDRAVDAAIRGPGGDFSHARQRVGAPGSPVPTNGWDDYVSPSINNRGQAVLAWQEWSDAVGVLKAAYKETGTAFGDARAVTLLSDESRRVVARATVDATGGAIIATTGQDASFSWRVPGGPPGPMTSFHGGTAWFLDLLGRPDTQVAMLRSGPFNSTMRVAIRETGHPFGPARAIRLQGFGGGELGTDARGNLHVGWEDPGRPMQAATLSRFDLKPSDLSGPLGPDGLASHPSMAVNPRGQAVMAWSSYVNDRLPSSPVVLTIADRAADADPPVLRVRTATRGGGGVRTRLRCSESCRARAAVGVSVARGKRARQSLSSVTKPVTLRPGKEQLLATRLKPAQRRRLRQLLRRRHHLKAVLKVTAEDGWGNRRVVRRRVSVRRLLGRR